MRGSNMHGGSRQVKINYNLVCDLERADKYKGFLTHLVNTKNLSKLLALIVKEIPVAISC